MTEEQFWGRPKQSEEEEQDERKDRSVLVGAGELRL